MIHSFSNIDLEKILNINWDFIIIGSGIGGGVISHELLLNSNLKVLLIEKGKISYNKKLKTDYWWPEKVNGSTTYGDNEHFLSIGCGVGGSSNLFAAQMERMKKIDFQGPDRRSNNAKEESQWPLNYDDFKLFYEKAENLFKIHGTNDPLDDFSNNSLLKPPPLTEFNKKFLYELKKSGLNPYRSHVATDIVSDCDGCAEKKCEYNCKNDTYKVCIKPSLKNKNFVLLSECDVKKINSNSEVIDSLSCEYDGKIISLKAKNYILSAGAINSPILLLESKSSKWPNGLSNNNGLIGRNLMWHISEIFALKPKNIKTSSFSKRQISFNDFYNTKNGKYGNFQEMGFNWFNFDKIHFIISKKIRLLNFFPINLVLKFISLIVSKYLENCVMYASVIEDYPKIYNRVFFKNNRVNYEYFLDVELLNRIKSFNKDLKRKLRSNFKVFKISGKNNINYGHPMGTCKMGTSSKDSVLDTNNKLHHIENMYVVDSSFFPTSSGINPSLTIAANAIRVAEFLKNHVK